MMEFVPGTEALKRKRSLSEVFGFEHYEQRPADSCRTPSSSNYSYDLEKENLVQIKATMLEGLCGDIAKFYRQCIFHFFFFK